MKKSKILHILLGGIVGLFLSKVISDAYALCDYQFETWSLIVIEVESNDSTQDVASEWELWDDAWINGSADMQSNAYNLSLEEG